MATVRLWPIKWENHVYWNVHVVKAMRGAEASAEVRLCEWRRPNCYDLYVKMRKHLQNLVYYYRL